MNAEHLIGAQITFDYDGRTLLGDVVGVTVEDGNSVRLTVRHFNGERWPVAPLANEVIILIRDFDTINLDD